MTQSAVTPAKKAPGIAKPTSRAERTPKAQTITIITRITAAITLASRSLSMSWTCSDSSWVYLTVMLSGHSARISSINSRTAATVSIIFAPERFLISSASAGWPSIRAKPVGSLKVRRIVATSAKVTTVSPRTLIGSDMTSSTFSISPGTLSTSRPAPLSIAPAAIRRLLRLIWLISSSKEML